VDEKVDVYALGNILFHILTTHSPRGKMKKERMEEVRADVLAGVKPEIPEFYAKHQDPAIKAIREAMDLCFVFEPEKRASSRQVANILLNTLVVLKKKRGINKHHARHHL
jgi:serine/threonine protein kinase